MALERALIRPTADVRKFEPTTDTLEVSDIDYVGAITLGTVNATGIDIGLIGILTTIKGDLQVDGTTTLVDTISAQGDVNLGNGGDTINIGFNATDIINLNTDLTVAAGILLDLVTNGGYLNLPTQAQAVAVDGTDGYLRLNIAGAADVLEFLDIGVGWVTVSFVGSVTLDDAYNASVGPSTITVDAGDVTWNEVGAYSFVVGLSGCTGVADGFIVSDGTDHFSLLHKGADTLDISSAVSTATVIASTLLELSGTNVTIENVAGAGAISIGCQIATNQISIGGAGARNIYVGSAAATTVVLEAQDLTFNVHADDVNLHQYTVSVTNIGAGTAIINIDADDAITIDSLAAGISLDGLSSSNFSITSNDVNTYTLTLSAVNAGAGKAFVDIFSDDETKLRATAGSVLIDSSGNLELNSSGGVINIGNDVVAQDINIGASASARTITIGNASSTGIYAVGALIDIQSKSTSVIITAKTNLNLDGTGVNIIGSGSSEIDLTTGGIIDINSAVGTWDATTLTLTATSTCDIDAAGALSLNSSAAVINIGNDNINQSINIGSAGVRTIAIGNVLATRVTVDAISFSIDSTDSSNLTMAADVAAVKTLTIAATNADLGGSGVLDIDATGDITIDSARRGISIDGVFTSNFTITANSAGNVDLGIASTNIGVGLATLGISCDDDMSISSTLGYLFVDASRGVEINSAAGYLYIGNDNVNQSITIGSAGARTIAVGSAAATAVTLDAIGISLDASTSSNFSITANDANVYTLTLTATNAGAGKGYVDVVSDDETKLRSTLGAVSIDAVGNVEINSSAGIIKMGNDAVAQNIEIGLAGARTIALGNVAATAVTLDALAISIDAANASNLTVSGAAQDLTLGARATTITLNQSGEESLVGFIATSLIGALNELKEGYLKYGVYTVVANTYAFNDFTKSVILVAYSATGTCTVTIDSDQVAAVGRSFVVKDSGQNAAANNITVETEGAETIEGEANYVINTDGGWLTFVSDGTNWHLI